MDIQTLEFNVAYDRYYNEIQNSLFPNIEILEVGGGAHPSLTERVELSYTIADPDENELEKAPNDVIKKNASVETLNPTQQYDLILTKMVLEHVKNPEAFHQKIFDLLKFDGKVIHFFACRNSMPSLVNRFISEEFGNRILKWIGNRDLNDSPKYPAYYLKTKGYNRGQFNFFTGQGFSIKKYHSFVGHKYFKKIPVLGALERLYSKVLLLLGLRCMATVALVVLVKDT
ncbi:MAG: methyltransferase domain-containing protein [Bacteroidota bacterium]